MKKKKKLKIITEKKLEFFFIYLHTCTFIGEYPYIRTAIQNNEVLLTLPRNITFIRRQHTWSSSMGRECPTPSLLSNLADHRNSLNASHIEFS